VQSGFYLSLTDVIQEALRLMVRLEQSQTAKLEELKALIDLGLNSVESGRVNVVNDELITEIKQLARQRVNLF
jgi:Arc/MetJ-type ribon-helix-helix transcriptional regulator